MKKFMILSLCFVITVMFGMSNVFADALLVITGGNSVEVGSTVDLSAKYVADSSSDGVDVTSVATWSSSDASKATVSAGKVTGVAEASEVTITAKYTPEGGSEVTATYKVAVTPKTNNNTNTNTNTSTNTNTNTSTSTNTNGITTISNTEDEPDDDTLVPKEKAKTVEKETIAGKQTASNPTTGIEDTLIYIIPGLLIIGSGLYLRKRFA